MSTTRYRCSACGNVTRFDVVATRRTRAFHHYTIGGELEIEEEEVLEEHVERVTCRWCNASGDKIEVDTPGRRGRGARGGGAAVVAVTPVRHARGMSIRTIDCDDCAMAHTSACDDCVVSFILRREPGEALVIDADEERALRRARRRAAWYRSCATTRAAAG